MGSLRGWNSSEEKRLLCSPKRPDLLRGPLSFLFNGNRFFLRVSGRIVKLQKTSSSTDVKNERSYISISLICLHGVDGEDVTFYLFKNKYSAVSEHGK